MSFIRKNSLNIICVINLFFLFLFGILFILSKSIIFPIILGLLFLANIIFFKRNRVYIIFLFLFFSVLLKPYQTSIGSFFTWGLFLYCFLIFLENLFSDSFKKIDIKMLTMLCLLISYSLLIAIINTDKTSLFKTISYCMYLSSIFFIMNDSFSDKDPAKIVIFISISLLFSNIFAMIFSFTSKNITRLFLEVACPNQLPHFDHHYSLRFSGLNGDPNHNSFFILLISSLLICNYTNTKKYFSLFCCLLLIPFALLSQSKNFLIVFAFVVVIYFLYFFYRSRHKLSILTSLLFFVILIIPLASVFLNLSIFKRFNFDSRISLLSALTTGRTDLQMQYINSLLSDPLHFLFGTGIFSTKLEGLNTIHNYFITMIWDLGIVGSFLYLAYLYPLFLHQNKSYTKKDLISSMPILIILFYSFSLELNAQVEIYFAMLALYYVRNDTQSIVGNRFFADSFEEDLIYASSKIKV